MTPTGMQRAARRVVLALLKTDPALTALVPAARWYPQAAPADPVWPFGKLGAVVTRGAKAAGVDLGEVAFAIHVFARAREVAGQVVETAEDHAARIGENVERVLADNRFGTVDGVEMRLSLSDFQLMQDDGPDAFHWFAQVSARVLAETFA